MASSINATSTGSGGIIQTADATGVLNIQTNETTAITVGSTQNVGIGTSSPGYKLDVTSASDASLLQIKSTASANNTAMRFGIDGNNSFINASGGSTGVLQLRVFGTTQATLDASGNLGLGVTPSSWATFKVMQIGNGTADTFIAVSGNQGDFGVNAYYNAGWKYQTSSVAASRYEQSSGTHAWYNAPNSGTGGAGTAVSWTQAMTLDASGNLGVGTTSPGAKFNVNGTALFNGTTKVTSNAVEIQGDMTLGNYSAYSTSNYRDILYSASTASYGNQPTAYIRFQTTSDVGSAILFATRSSAADYAERARIDSSGNMGIGTTGPGYKLDVFSSGASVPQVNIVNASTTNGAGISLGDSYSDAAIKTIPAGSTTSLGFFVAGKTTERMRIDSSGNLLINTTTSTPASITSHKLVVERTSTAYAAAFGYVTDSSARTQVSFYNSNGAVGTISTSGTATAYNTSSDQRLKKNIQNAEDASSLIDALQVRQFDWKADGSHQRYGFVAQELVTVAPEAVHQPENPDEMMAVDYSKLVPMLVKELQSLRARVAQLEGN